MVSQQAIDEFKKNDVELSVPAGAPRPTLIIVMGPASCGKSTIGHALSHSLSLPFIDGDTLHPQSNIDKMSAGIPLTDDDRLPWLGLIRSTAERISRDEWNDSGYKIKSVQEGGIGRPGVVIACSALKVWYRDILRGDVESKPPGKDDLPINHAAASSARQVHHPATDNLETLFLYCHGTQTVLEKRIADRKGHFMGAQMLRSQLATLEDPRGEKGVAWVDIDQSPEEVGRQATEGVRGLVAK